MLVRDSVNDSTDSSGNRPYPGETVYDRLADGRFRPKIARTFPFAKTVEAYRYLESNAQVGKVVITVP